MKKLGIAVALAGLFIVGCGDSGGGLVKLENKNPTIDQRKFDLYVEFLNNKYGKEYDFYHILSAKNQNSKNEDTKHYVSIALDKINDDEYYVFATKKNDKEVMETIKLKCGYGVKGKCDTANDISYSFRPFTLKPFSFSK